MAFVIGPYTRKQITEYCRRVNDTNPFHFSAQSAARAWDRVRRVPFGVVVVPGMQILEEYPQQVIKWLGLGSSFLGIKEMKFAAPSFSGEALQASMTVLRRVRMRQDMIYEVATDIRVEGLERPVLTAIFTMLVPTPGTVV